MKVLLSTVKRFNHDRGVQFCEEKCAKVTFKKGFQVNSKNITLDIYTDITELEHNKINKYLRINKVNGINHIVHKKIRK